MEQIFLEDCITISVPQSPIEEDPGHLLYFSNDRGLPLFKHNFAYFGILSLGYYLSEWDYKKNAILR